jgi:hypothetical protein
MIMVIGLPIAIIRQLFIKCYAFDPNVACSKT